MAQQPDEGTKLTRFLVVHDYGMGALYWWIEARSAEAIMRTYAEVQVVDLTRVDLASLGEIATIGEGDATPVGLRELKAKRCLQREMPGFGVLIGRGSVYLRRNWEEEGEIYCLEYNEHGYRTRQVVSSPDGQHEGSGPDDWAFNPPEDLWAPELAAYEISREEFEALWVKANLA